MPPKLSLQDETIDETYAISYNDGDTEDAVKRPLIRTEEPIWSEGHSVEVRKEGTGHYLLGVVTRHNRGTFDVDFGDGRIERRVGPERMREPPARESGLEGVGGEEGAALPTAQGTAPERVIDRTCRGKCHHGNPLFERFANL